jgi:hypothetical protein
VSHQPERKEKNCLNCGTTVVGRFCHVCGQENIVTKQGFWQVVSHFLYDLFHFDSNFFSTLKHLLFRPGFIPREYVEGRRKSYLDPIKMYFFTSALFFLIFFSVADPVKIGQDQNRLMTRQERIQYASMVYRELGDRHDPSLQRQLGFLLDTNYRISLKRQDTLIPSDSAFMMRINNLAYVMTAKKGSPVTVYGGPNWIGKKMESSWQAYRQKYGDDTNAMLRNIINTFLHKLPYVLFVSLPFFALILKLLYVRRKQFYYSDHAVFTLYHYIFTFILLLLYISIARLYEWLSWGILNFLGITLFLSGGLYLFIAMKKFYQQGWGKTLAKFLLLNFLGGIVLVFLFFAFLVFSIFQI